MKIRLTWDEKFIPLPVTTFVLEALAISGISGIFVAYFKLNLSIPVIWTLIGLWAGITVFACSKIRKIEKKKIKNRPIISASRFGLLGINLSLGLIMFFLFLGSADTWFEKGIVALCGVIFLASCTKFAPKINRENYSKIKTANKAVERNAEPLRSQHPSH